jgi:hypothetical protein
MYQDALGNVRRASRESNARVDRQIWPKAAWWLRGGVRVASRCSDAPVKKPLIPLHVFIKALGPLPPLQALNTYVMRLREHGWNVWKPIQKALQCGAHMDAAVARVVRLSVRSIPSDSARLMTASMPPSFHCRRSTHASCGCVSVAGMFGMVGAAGSLCLRI